MTVPHLSKWMFVIDTDSYAGNFERHMAGYVVGGISDGHGDKESEVFDREVPKEIAEDIQAIIDYPLLEHDGIGYTANNAICETPGEGGKYQSVAIFFEERPTQDQLSFMMERAKKYMAAPKAKDSIASKPDNLVGFRLIKTAVSRRTMWKSPSE